MMADLSAFLVPPKAGWMFVGFRGVVVCTTRDAARDRKADRVASAAVAALHSSGWVPSGDCLVLYVASQPAHVRGVLVSERAGAAPLDAAQYREALQRCGEAAWIATLSADGQLSTNPAPRDFARGVAPQVAACAREGLVALDSAGVVAPVRLAAP